MKKQEEGSISLLNAAANELEILTFSIEEGLLEIDRKVSEIKLQKRIDNGIWVNGLIGTGKIVPSTSLIVVIKSEKLALEAKRRNYNFFPVSNTEDVLEINDDDFEYWSVWMILMWPFQNLMILSLFRRISRRSTHFHRTRLRSLKL